MFQIHAKFMGVRLEHVDIDIQDLLQLQYEGVAVMNVFGKAKINVNLLLFLLNTKFYTRKRRWTYRHKWLLTTYLADVSSQVLLLHYYF